MSLLIAGTFPARTGETLCGPAGRDSCGRLTVAGEPLPTSEGSAAMLAAAVAVTAHLGVEPPVALFGHDCGRGEGTRAVYGRLRAEVESREPSVLAFHRLLPTVALMREAIGWLSPYGEEGRIRLVADAGGMYAARAAGVAHRFELMTPNAAEATFLASEAATHPAYASCSLLRATGFDPAELARLAYERGGSSRVLLIKGIYDVIAEEGQVRERVTSPSVPALEAIGGTGDTLAGIAAALMGAGFPTAVAAVCAARANRTAGLAIAARPDHRAEDLVAALGGVFTESLCMWAGVCGSEGNSA